MSISKETFCKALRLIREQEEINREFSNALNTVGGGHYVFGVKNKYFDALMMVLKEALPDKYDYIDWWLYEGEPDFMIWSKDEDKSWVLKEPEVLYDFITIECQ